MSIIDTMKGMAAIQKVAEREGKPYAEIEAAMQEAIDFAWTDPTAREYQNMLFPKGKPTAAEFIGRIAHRIKDGELPAEEQKPI